MKDDSLVSLYKFQGSFSKSADNVSSPSGVFSSLFSEEENPAPRKRKRDTSFSATNSMWMKPWIGFSQKFGERIALEYVRVPRSDFLRQSVVTVVCLVTAAQPSALQEEWPLEVPGLAGFPLSPWSWCPLSPWRWWRNAQRTGLQELARQGQSWQETLTEVL